ncbi:MAG TPA: hypothetical protein VII56_09475 [Rhizomicrobium sp.]
MSTKNSAIGLAAILVLAALQSAPPALAQTVFMGDCKGDPALEPGHVIAACTGFISRTLQENWQTEYDAEALFYRAKAYERLDKYAAAQADLRMAIKLQPGAYPPLWSEFGEVSEKLGSPGQLSAALDAMIKANPNDADMLNEACWSRGKHNQQLELAFADCNEADRLKPNNAGILQSRCFVRFRLGQFANAAADCNAALAVAAKMASALYVRGLADIRLGHADLGNADIAAARAIDPNIADRYAGYGVTP